MRYTIIIAPRAKKQIDKFPSRIKQKIAAALEELSTNPFLGKALKVDLKGLYSYRAGNYRVIYSILRHRLMIQIIKVMHRKDVYR
ncbi:MAG: type II toxin-antitoxin system RelE/ParE family toxin [Candidatus Omnitrophica bacterium]|nr:type II toxin-antitoxin system RelE/ParE family toxin [Candidatus Omnitrophota bacterium]